MKKVMLALMLALMGVLVAALLIGCGLFGSDNAATVNGEAITIEELDEAVAEGLEWRAEAGEEFEIDEDELRVSILDGLINSMRRAQVIEELNIQISDEDIDRELQQPFTDYSGIDWDALSDEELRNVVGVEYDSYEEYLRTLDWDWVEEDDSVADVDSAIRRSVQQQLEWRELEAHALERRAYEAGIEIREESIDSRFGHMDEMARWVDDGEGNFVESDQTELEYMRTERGMSDEEIREEIRDGLLQSRLSEWALLQWAQEEDIEVTDEEVEERLMEGHDASWMPAEEWREMELEGWSSDGLRTEDETFTLLRSEIARDRLAATRFNEEEARQFFYEMGWNETEEHSWYGDADEPTITTVSVEFGERHLRDARSVLFMQSDEHGQRIWVSNINDLLFEDADIRVYDSAVLSWLENNEPDEWTFNFDWQ